MLTISFPTVSHAKLCKLKKKKKRYINDRERDSNRLKNAKEKLFKATQDFCCRVTYSDLM